jgi:hypothetical protein
MNDLLWLVNHPLRGNVTGLPTSQNPKTPEGLKIRFSIIIRGILTELPCLTELELGKLCRTRMDFGSATVLEPVLYATSFPHVILSVTMPYFGHNEYMHGFWSIWCFFVIRCSWNGRSIKLVELISNKHLSSISWMKYRYVGTKYMHFMTANTPPHLEFCSFLSKRK